MGWCLRAWTSFEEVRATRSNDNFGFSRGKAQWQSGRAMFEWFKGRSNRADAKEKLSPEVEAIFRKIDRLMSDEKVQNAQLPEPFRSEVSRGLSCDELAGATGEFGHDLRNPIPVNGPLGELIYLSNLRTTDLTPILFHRLGSIGKVDIFEIVSFDASLWDILFLDPYHPRKSRQAPGGYQIASKEGRAQLFRGGPGFRDRMAALPRWIPDLITPPISPRYRS